MDEKSTRLLGVMVLGFGLVGACDSGSDDDERVAGDTTGGEGIVVDTAEENDLHAVGDGGYSTMQGGCEEFPQSFEEVAGAYVQNAQFGRVVQYNAFSGLVEGHASAEGIFEVTLWGKYGAQLEEGEIIFGGDDLSYDTCANCVVYHQGARMKNGKLSSADHVFMPAEGSIMRVERLEARAGGMFKFILDAEMVEVDMDFESLSAIPKTEGCRFRFEGFSRSIVLDK